MRVETEHLRSAVSSLRQQVDELLHAQDQWAAEREALHDEINRLMVLAGAVGAAPGPRVHSQSGQSAYSSRETSTADASRVPASSMAAATQAAAAAYREAATSADDQTVYERESHGEGQQGGERHREGEWQQNGERHREGEGQQNGERHREGEEQQVGERHREGEGQHNGERQQHSEPTLLGSIHHYSAAERLDPAQLRPPRPSSIGQHQRDDTPARTETSMAQQEMDRLAREARTSDIRYKVYRARAELVRTYAATIIPCFTSQCSCSLC